MVTQETIIYRLVVRNHAFDAFFKEILFWRENGLFGSTVISKYMFSKFSDLNQPPTRHPPPPLNNDQQIRNLQYSHWNVSLKLAHYTITEHKDQLTRWNTNIFRVPQNYIQWNDIMLVLFILTASWFSSPLSDALTLFAWFELSGWDGQIISKEIKWFLYQWLKIKLISLWANCKVTCLSCLIILLLTVQKRQGLQHSKYMIYKIGFVHCQNQIFEVLR